MRWKPGFVFALILGGVVPAAAQDTAPESLDQLAPEIDALFTKYQADQHIPGMVYVVVRDGQLASVKGIGVQTLAAKRRHTPDRLLPLPKQETRREGTE